MRSRTRAIVDAIEPWDDTEAAHRRDVLDWIDSGAPLHRVAKPATPPKHLASYALVVDPDAAAALLIHHRLSGLWLPAGGHVEGSEEPSVAARREVGEELGIDGAFLAPWQDTPFFVTVTRTVGPQGGHCDVSLWFAFRASRSTAIRVDEREAIEARWWPFDEVDPAARTSFDPHLARAIAKLSATLAAGPGTKRI